MQPLNQYVKDAHLGTHPLRCVQTVSLVQLGGGGSSANAKFANFKKFNRGNVASRGCCIGCISLSLARLWLASVFDLCYEMPVEVELYELLGVSVDASEDEIKKAYRKKAKEHHPVKNPNDPEASQKFQEMAAAYEILSDPNKREVYDSYGMDGVAGRGGKGGGPPGMDPADIFAEFFGGGGPGMFSFDFGGGPRSGRRRGSQDSIIEYDVTLEDLYNGKSVKMNMEREVVCESCKGSGARGSAKPRKCVKCEGKGWTYVHSQIGPSQLATSRAVCSECDGEGEKLREKDRCKKCKGEKTVKEKTRQEIHIEKGMSDRQRIVLAGAGDQTPGSPPGDVVFVLKLKQHESFERSGNDLLATVKITLSEALLGFSRVLITHLDGRGVRVSSPPGKVVKFGDTIVLRGEGMPTYKRPDEKGDLYVVMQVEMPDEEWLRSTDRAALEKLLPPKKAEVDPLPAVVHEADYEECDIADFGEDEDGWEDEDEDEDDFHPGMGGEPDCRQQ
ncbi:DnaJ-domain-containing protein [Gloeophyllum trabeum ATCC 11539]|uniref:DnaJ-domain-containing protein n=1 Tax=Gloeophyllum trabeum (strain ATCC 11539 / FP-39264 / Madison 617) TaxID=670483 RepID=S7PZ35_GLOTA|nr:DnaJ-domain-containing protein [Gloeophyllum trabeum ATCC 11539]EPQ52738.1 DnaJ-domain-containing protein [Gloeophyllum trabeum ATCC 11539]